jgi:hypothetical protein
MSGNIKISLRKADGSGGIVIKENYPANILSYNYSLSLVKSGKYFVKIKQGKVFGKSSVFTILNNKTKDNKNYLTLARNRNDSAIQFTKYQPSVRTIDFKRNLDPYGKLEPVKLFSDIDSKVNIKIYFTNATRVKVYNKRTKNIIYSWTNKETNSNSLFCTVTLLYVENEYEMEVWGTKKTYYANCRIIAKPVVNEFKIKNNLNGKTVFYRFTGCEHAYLKKCRVGDNYWIRVKKLEGNLVRRGTISKKGKVDLLFSSNNKTKYALFLIGNTKQGVVKSHEIVLDFWTNQMIRLP